MRASRGHRPSWLTGDRLAVRRRLSRTTRMPSDFWNRCRTILSACLWRRRRSFRKSKRCVLLLSRTVDFLLIYHRYLIIFVCSCIRLQASEEAIVKLRNSAAVATDHLLQQQQPHYHHHNEIYYVVNQILYPVVQGCETKEPKIVKVYIIKQ